VSPRRRRVDKRRSQELTLDQMFELTIGPRGASVFASDADRRAAWEAHRDELLAIWEAEAVRPWAFWRYEPGLPPELRERDRPRLDNSAGRELDRRRRAWLA